MNDQDVMAIGQLVVDHKWVAVASVVIGLLVRLSKTDVRWFPTLDARWRALLAVVLGVASGVLDKVATGTAWAPALIGGLVSGMLAVTSHDVVIEGFRRGRELDKPKDSPPPPPPSGGQDVLRESRRAPPIPPVDVDIREAETPPESFPRVPKLPPSFLVPLLLALGGCGGSNVAHAERVSACGLVVDKAFRDHPGRGECLAAEEQINQAGVCKANFSLRCPPVTP